MLKFRNVKPIQCLLQRRNLCEGLILNKTKKSVKPKSTAVLNGSKKPRKARKPKVIAKKSSDDIEEIWLENLNKENLKLYRKTSFGTYKVIKTSKLLEKLKEIYPSNLEMEECVTETSEKLKKSSSAAEVETENEIENGFPCMSNYLIKNLMQFPLLKIETDDNISQVLKLENETFGNIDASMFPSVSKILYETMSESSKAKLKKYKEDKIEELGLEGFKKHQSDLLKYGSKLHSTIKRYLEFSDKSLVKVDPELEGCWNSLQTVLPDISDVQMIEQPVYHPILLYRGIVDCVASYRGNPCVMEWKHTSKVKTGLSSTYDAPLQACAYLGTLSWINTPQNLPINNALVVVAYKNGSPAEVYQMDSSFCHVYWTEWLKRLQFYWAKRSSLLIQEEE